MNAIADILVKNVGKGKFVTVVISTLLCDVLLIPVTLYVLLFNEKEVTTLSVFNPIVEETTLATPEPVVTGV